VLIAFGGCSTARAFAHRALAAALAISERWDLLNLRCLSVRALSIATLRSCSDVPAQRFLPIALAALETSISSGFFFNRESSVESYSCFLPSLST
jgi:hypothetical protein